MKFIIFIFMLLAACTPDALDFGQSSTNQKSDVSNNGGSNGGSDVGNNGQGDVSANNGSADVSESTGAGLFQTNCLVCHGPDGAGATVWQGSIQGFVDISPAVKEGVGTMAMVSMPDADIAKIQAFLISKTPATIDGKVKYAQECAGCHGNEGKGIEKRGFQLRYKDPGYSSSITRAGRFIYNFEFSTSGMPGFDAAELSDVHMEEIWVWLDSLPNETTDAGLYVQFCNNCHGPDGGASEVERVIGGRPDSTSDIRSGHNAGNYDARTRYMTSWDATQISDAEILQINAHVSGL